MTTKAPSKQITPTARVVDWEGIERDYRAGMLSVREIALAFGVSNTGIHKRADKYGWSRDLTAKINQAANELVMKASIAPDGSTKLSVKPAPKVLVRTAEQVSLNASIEARTIEIAAQRVADVRLAQRQDISRMRAAGMKLLAELELMIDVPVSLVQLGEIMRNPEGSDQMNDLYRRVISMPGRITNAQKLADTLKTLVALEREAYEIDKARDNGENLNPLAALLASMRHSALSVVHQSALPDGLVDDD